MSAWRRNALRSLPEHRARLERVRDVGGLLRLLRAVLPASLGPDGGPTELSWRIADVAFTHRAAPEALTVYYQPLLAAPDHRHLCVLAVPESVLPDHLDMILDAATETHRRALEAARAAFFDRFECRALVRRARAEVDRLTAAAPAQQEALAAAWRDSVMFFEAGETRLGMEVLLDRLEHLAALLPTHALTDWDGNGG